jgi:hypothetical protein
MIQRLCAVATVLLLSSCYTPEIKSVQPYTPSLGAPAPPLSGWMEDQPKMVRAEVKPSSNMTYDVHVEITPVPAGGASVPRLELTGAGNAPSGDRLFEGTVPLGAGSPPEPPAGYPAMPYGTQWQARVSVPYKNLWQTSYVFKSETFTVGAALGCMSFDGPRQSEGWGAKLYSSRDYATPLSTLPTQWLENENARQSDVPAARGALEATVAMTPEPIGAERFEARFSHAGVLPAGWGNARGIRIAIKSSSTGPSIYANVLVKKGLVPGTTVDDTEWIPVHGVWNAGSVWSTVEFPYPQFPTPHDPNVPTHMVHFTLNVDGVGDDTTITIDDVCPLR